jgi:aminoglycoside phosphotransferase (APT) family kinase protein
MNLLECLPASLRGESPRFTPIGAGMSGASVHRVEVGDRTYVLKVASEGPLDDWRIRAQIQQAAAKAGVAPVVVHVDEARRAVLSELVVDRVFPILLMNPATRADALTLLGQTLRRVHDLPAPSGAPILNPIDVLSMYWACLTGFPLPAFVGDTVARVRGETPPPKTRALSPCHNDVNPTNMVFDGERLLLLDWDSVGLNDPLFDVATIAMFFRLDDAGCRAVLSAHDGTPITDLPPRLSYLRRLVAVMCGCGVLHAVRRAGHPGSSSETLESTASLADVYQRMRAGTLSTSSADFQWTFALALVKSGAELP